MAASAADIRSALSLPGPSTPALGSRKSAGTHTKKPEGISRELYALIGPSAPSLAAQLAKPRLKQKPNFGSGGKARWEWIPFTNGARKDSLQLNHWAKVGTDPSAGYAFTQYNVEPTVYIYSQDEYTRFLEDKDWTKEETDYLFDIVREYETRWYVIHDRYEFPTAAPRQLEDLKDRYYSVCRKLIRNRPWAGDEASKAQLISSFQFDKERETIRKNYLLSLESRTPEQIAEEEALFIEIKRLEQNERRFKKDREELLRTLGGIDSGLPDIVVDEESFAGMSLDTKKKKRNGGTADAETPTTPSNIISLGPPVPKKTTTPKIINDVQHCIIRTEPPPSANSNKIVHQPVYLRSFKLPTPKAAIAPRVTQALAELGISTARLVMPTRDNIAKLESLMDVTTALIDIKKVVDKTEQDIRVLKVRLGSRASEGLGTADDTPMEVDEGNDAQEEDSRAQSVVSTRSGRSRKQTRRSMSISSIDTSGSVSTRAGTKRQKRS